MIEIKKKKKTLIQKFNLRKKKRLSKGVVKQTNNTNEKQSKGIKKRLKYVKLRNIRNNNIPPEDRMKFSKKVGI